METKVECIYKFEIDPDVVCPICSLGDYTCRLKFPNDEFDCDGDLKDRPEWCPLVDLSGKD